MKACDVPRLICETALGIGNSVGRLGLPHTLFILPLILPFYMWDKFRQEELIIASDRDWVIVRPGVLTNGAARGSLSARTKRRQLSLAGEDRAGGCRGFHAEATEG